MQQQQQQQLQQRLQAAQQRQYQLGATGPGGPEFDTGARIEMASNSVQPHALQWPNGMLTNPMIAMPRRAVAARTFMPSINPNTPPTLKRLLQLQQPQFPFRQQQQCPPPPGGGTLGVPVTSMSSVGSVDQIVT